MTKRLFGTDGVRGVANDDLTPELAFRLGEAAALFLGKKIVLGKDTRKSGDMLEAAFAAGATSAGADIHLAGVIPTPAVALLTRQLDADGGVVISASHNPPEYNGIKFFDSRGYKLSVAHEDEIEAFLQSCEMQVERGIGDAVGRIVSIENAIESYIDHSVSMIEDEGIDFTGLTIAIDCAHGASSKTSPEACRRLGGSVIAINDTWDGNDINVACGSTHLDSIRALVLETGADIGVAHDGDADRVLMVDEAGNEVDGDFIEAICAVDLAERGELARNTIVSTVMCNLGFRRAMEKHGIEVVTTQVGDRYVLERMREEGFVLGGEQSGHIIFLEYNTTGDGLVTALQLIAIMKRKCAKLSSLAKVVTRYPQTLINVHVADKHALGGNEKIASAIASAEEMLGDDGRVLVRTSGTEPLVRVMVEAADEGIASSVASEIAAIVEAELN
ncbi:MAG: phosphoglucosamine mutase [Actinobacteria bacterium]|nr:phosphoglucosamine mutase [Actinomycetota bacterium]